MSNEFFTSSSIPGTGAQGSSAAIRAEFEQLVAAFDKLPVLAGNAGEIVSINGTGTALENSTYKISDFVTLAAPGVLPALDGSLLTNLNAALFGTVSVAGGGTGATTLEGAQTALGIDLKANSLNATLTGAPVAPTPAPADDSTRIATTEYVNTALDAFSVSVGAVVQGSAPPLVDGPSASAGTAAAVSREDHVHPRDTTKANLASPTFTGVVTLPVVAGSDNSAAAVYSSWVRTYVGAYAMPTSQVTGLDAALAGKAALAGATFSGAVNVPTLTLGDNSTKAVNSAYLESWKTTLPGGVAVSNTDPLMNGAVAYEGVSPDASRVDHVHPSDTSRAGLGANTFTGHQTLPGGGTGNQAVTATELATKANTSHTHTLANITDAGDAAGKTVGVIGGVQAYDAATAKTNIKQTFTKQQTPMSGTLTDGATIDWNGDVNGQVVALTLGGNRTMNAPTNIVQNTMYLLRVKQPASGGPYTIGPWNAAFKFGAAGAPTLSTAANAVDFISFVGGAGNTLECLGTRLNAVT